MKPRIAVTDTGNEVKQANYLRWLQKAGELDLVIINVANDNADILQQCHGLVLTGGTDVHPSYYGRKKKDYPHAPAHFDKKRDQLEAACFESAMNQRIPVLAICRGMQLSNCLLGGSLIQDLGKKGNQIHKAVGVRDKGHAVEVVEGTLLHEMVGQSRMLVNAAHHQALDRLAPRLRISASSDDGIIEAVEWAEPDAKPFFVGVQWHPERMFAFGLDESPASAPLRQRFFDEVKRKSIA